MRISLAIISAVATFAFVGQTAAQDSYKPTAEKHAYRLSDDMKKSLEAGDRNQLKLNQTLFAYVSGLCMPDPFVPCNCTFEGFAASCDFVLSCLANGLCVADN